MNAAGGQLDVQFSGVFYCVFRAFLLYVIFLVFEKKKVSYAATGFMAIGLALQTVAIVLRSLAAHHLPLTNMFEYISIFAWFAAILYFVALRIYKLQIIGAFISPIIFMLMASASLLPKDVAMQLVPALQSYWLQIHVSVAALGESAFGVGFAFNIMYFLKQMLPENGSFSKRIPDLKKLDQFSYKAVTFGYPLFTVGALFAGAIWAEQAWFVLELGPERSWLSGCVAGLHRVPSCPTRAWLTALVPLSSVR